MSHSTLIERITRSLAYMLRHKPEEFDLQLDRQGFAGLSEVVQALNERLGEPIEEAQVARAIACGDRERYEIVDGRIRALYGHSIEVDPGAPGQPPALLFIGLDERDAERARRNGLHGGRRRFLHLALTEEEAIETGRRSARDYVVITVHALDAWEQDVNFYNRRAMFLSEPIPTEFIEVGEVRHDGSPRQDRPDRSDRSDRPDRNDRNERHGRGGRHDRRGRGEGRGERRESRGADRSRPDDGGHRGRGPERAGEGRSRDPRSEREGRAGERGGREGGRSGRPQPERRPPQRREPQRREPGRPVEVGAAPPSGPPARSEEAPERTCAPSSGFGSGVFDPVPVRSEAAPAPASPPPAAPPPAAAQPEEAHEPEAEPPSGGSERPAFGAGL